MRDVITELEGDLQGRQHDAHRAVGLSVQVLDSLVCYRIVGQWRTEDYGGSVTRRRELVRNRAERLAAKLNGETPPPPVEPKPLPTPQILHGRAAVCRNGHWRTDENTYYRANGSRECRLCRDIVRRRYGKY